MKNSKEYLIFQGIREKTYSRNKREDNEYDNTKYTIWNIYEKQNISYVLYI